MKVLYITNCPSPYRVKFFNELSKYCDLTVVFEMKNAKNRNQEWKSEESFHFRGVFLRSVFSKEESAFCPEVIRYINEHKKDIIVVGGYSTPTGMYSILYMKWGKVPFILNCDGGLIKEDSFVKKRIKELFIGSASAWLSTGKTSDEYLINYGADSQRIFHYPFTSIKEKDVHPVDLEEKEELKKRLGIKEKQMVLFVGSFIYRKGLDVLLTACMDMKETALVLVGGNDITKYLEKSDMEKTDNIYIAGFKSGSEIEEYYQAADVFVLPTREDIWGLVVNEAMAVGLPVITTNRCVSGLELIKDGENGYLVSVDNSTELREKIKLVLENVKLQKHMSERNVEKMRNYTIEAMAKRHMEIFQNWKRA